MKNSKLKLFLLGAALLLSVGAAAVFYESNKEQTITLGIYVDSSWNVPNSEVGIGTLLTRLAFGLSTAPIFSASPRIKGVKASDSKNVAAIDASILYICRPLSVSSLCANTADSAQQICKHESLQVQNTFYHKSKTNKRRGPKS